MISWRDNASIQAQGDLDGLFSESLNAAIHFLGKNKEFYPFALALSTDGKSSVAVTGQDEEFPDSQSRITYDHSFPAPTSDETGLVPLR